ncbi:MAG: hypothetical protein GXY03_07670 [Solirubrobacterales bacterium]|nr:hypothetical protein [Solirubrobacterales bacterium]
MNDLVLVRGMDATRRTLRRWNARPWTVIAPWTALSAAIALLMLAAVVTVAASLTPDPTLFRLPGLDAPPTAGDFAYLLYRNGLVLALHAMACVAGFIAGSSLPLAAANRSGVDRWVHERAGPLAIAFVAGATLFSLVTQTFALGLRASDVAGQLGIAPATLAVGLAPHAIPELTALFLPLAAWLIASRKGRWDELLAATFVTVALAVPVLLASAAVELYVSPELLRALAGM